MSLNLEEVCYELGMKFPITQMSKDLGYSKSTISGYYNKKVPLSDKFEKAFIRFYKITEQNIEEKEINKKGLGYSKQQQLRSIKTKQQLYYPDIVVTNSNVEFYDKLHSGDVEVREMYDPNLEGADVVLPNYSDSNEPYIKSGDLVGYRKLEVNSYDSLNLDLLYMIVTVNSQRMNKKLQVFKGDDAKMWAISINNDKHKPFPILKKDIVEIWEVVGVSRRFI